MCGSSFLLRTSGVLVERRPPRPRTQARRSSILPFVMQDWFYCASQWRFDSEFEYACRYPQVVTCNKHDKSGSDSSKSSWAKRWRCDYVNLYMIHVYLRKVKATSCKLYVNPMPFRLICFVHSVALWLEFKIIIRMYLGSVCYDIRGIWSRLDDVWLSYINLHFYGEWCFGMFDPPHI